MHVRFFLIRVISHLFCNSGKKQPSVIASSNDSPHTIRPGNVGQKLETVKSTSFLAKFRLCTYTGKAGTKPSPFQECEISEYSEQIRPGVFEEKSNVLCKHNQAQSKERERKNKEYFSGK
ncbi:hypothetical protein CEXT_291821 [Caerostris extrusa]|uniref:Uncharacterized protein n=1 Tax=Caerostris extrusa TaxID=172846 RepID=A0AAV4YF56_CAEEX|nr:hypothetical protein CEXT_291821 [Caerostris extrusa]